MMPRGASLVHRRPPGRLIRHMPAPRSRRRAGALRSVAGIAVAIAALAACPAAPTSPSGTPSGEPVQTVEPTPLPEPEATDAATIESARRSIEHIVFVIKENRTFDHLFGRFPGADGATQGRLCNGETVRLHLEEDIPNYWAYAREFVLADNFFSSIYGPTGIEHQWTFASQSDRFTDHERPGQFATGQREFCDDPFEQMWSFRELSSGEERKAFRLEEGGGAGAEKLRDLWTLRWPCTDVEVLPDLLERAGLTWKEYRGENQWVQPLRIVRHVRFSGMWNNVFSDTEFLKDVE